MTEKKLCGKMPPYACADQSCMPSFLSGPEVLGSAAEALILDSESCPSVLALFLSALCLPAFISPKLHTFSRMGFHEPVSIMHGVYALHTYTYNHMMRTCVHTHMHTPAFGKLIFIVIFSSHQLGSSPTWQTPPAVPWQLSAALSPDMEPASAHKPF